MKLQTYLLTVILPIPKIKKKITILLGRYNFKKILMKFFLLGISRLRGVVMYELQSTLSTYAKRKYSSGEISVEHLKNILKVRKKHATVALIYLSLKW